MRGRESDERGGWDGMERQDKAGRDKGKLGIRRGEWKMKGRQKMERAGEAG